MVCYIPKELALRHSSDGEEGFTKNKLDHKESPDEGSFRDNYEIGQIIGQYVFLFFYILFIYVIIFSVFLCLCSNVNLGVQHVMFTLQKRKKQ